MTFAPRTDNDRLRHLSSEIIQARFHAAAGLKCHITTRLFMPLHLRYRNIYMTHCPHSDVKEVIKIESAELHIF